jgi:hypothetical protein
MRILDQRLRGDHLTIDPDHLINIIPLPRVGSLLVDEVDNISGRTGSSRRLAGHHDPTGGDLHSTSHTALPPNHDTNDSLWPAFRHMSLRRGDNDNRTEGELRIILIRNLPPSDHRERGLSREIRIWKQVERGCQVTQQTRVECGWQSMARRP